MLTIRVCHYYWSSEAGQTREVDYQAEIIPTGTLATTTTSTPPLQNYRLDIVQIVESAFTVTYYALFDQEGGCVQSTDAITYPQGTGSRRGFSAHRPQTRTPSNTPYTNLNAPLTFDVETHIAFRNTITTTNTFTLRIIWPSLLHN